MQIHEVTREHGNRKHVKIGRGGVRGKYSGKGIKGQKARAGHRMRPELRDLIKKLPKKRGFGKNRSHTVDSSLIKASVVNVAVLSAHFESGAIITPEVLVSKKLIRKIGGRLPAVKVLGGGEVTKKLTVSNCLVSPSAKVKLEAAGGTVA